MERTIRFFLCDERRSSSSGREMLHKVRRGKERMPWKTKKQVNDVVGRETRGALLLMTGKEGGGPFYYSMGD